MKLNVRVGPPHGVVDHRIDLRRQREIENARRAGWPQLDRDDLIFRRYGIVEHRPTGALYAAHRGQHNDVLYSTAAAFYIDGDGGVAFLERQPASFPQTADELAARRADRTARRGERA